LGGLAALFGNSEEKPQDSEKLMDLYWNRAELKKSFANQRKEQYKLQDQIKREEGKSARLQQKLDHLEDLLLDPQWVYNIVVFYQLRNLALSCERNLARFAEQLKLQREQKQHEEMMAEWKAKLGEESAQLEEMLLNHRNHMQQLEDQLAAQQQALDAMGIFAKLFKGRAVKAGIKQSEQQLQVARAEEAAMLADLGAISERAEPENRGLDTASKRSINLMILAFAQELYVNFEDNEFATLVKDSSEKSAGSVNYGNKHECTQIMERIEKHMELMEQNKDFADVLRKRVTLLGQKAEFHNKSDVVPIAASADTVFVIDEDGSIRERQVSILGENWWAIAKVLSR
jgi:hypothetical protein